MLRRGFTETMYFMLKCVPIGHNCCTFTESMYGINWTTSASKVTKSINFLMYAMTWLKLLLGHKKAVQIHWKSLHFQIFPLQRLLGRLTSQLSCVKWSEFSWSVQAHSDIWISITVPKETAFPKLIAKQRMNYFMHFGMELNRHIECCFMPMWAVEGTWFPAIL